LINTYRNERTLSYQSLTNPDISNTKIWPKNHIVLVTKIQFHYTNSQFAQNQSFENCSDNLASFYFPKIELEYECDPNLNLAIQFHFLNQYWLWYLYRFYLLYRVSIDSYAHTSWDWITNILKSHFVDGTSVWTLIFGLDSNFAPIWFLNLYLI